MNKAISFSLWGNSPVYCAGAIKNVELKTQFYKDWDFIIHYDKTVPFKYIDKLNELDCILINQDNSKVNPYFWRFLSSEDYDVTIFRDCDSRISLREEAAVNEWILSNKRIHVMRDHPAHIIPYPCYKPAILAGMWGIMKRDDYNLNIDIIKFLTNNKTEYSYGLDQLFLLDVFNKFENDALFHDEFYLKTKFPTERIDYHFIGERFDENDIRGNDFITLINK